MIDPEVLSYYERRPEEHRLLSGPAQLEALRTKALIEHHAPPSPGVVIDIGGASGAYAFWLAERGYAVHLVDASGRLVLEAEHLNADAIAPLASCRVGDARSVDFATGAADVVLLLGPLYHLTESSDRAQALVEAARVLKPGGVIFAAAISRWASSLDGLARDLFATGDHWSLVDRALDDGQHRNPTRRVGQFTTAYFHTPDGIREELTTAGFDLLGVFALEGIAGFLPDFDARWADLRQRADIIRVAELLQSEPSLLGATPHLLAVGRTPIASVV
jgi:SAM-dependent methyltransferase